MHRIFAATSDVIHTKLHSPLYYSMIEVVGNSLKLVLEYYTAQLLGQVRGNETINS